MADGCGVSAPVCEGRRSAWAAADRGTNGRERGPAAQAPRPGRHTSAARPSSAARAPAPQLGSQPPPPLAWPRGRLRGAPGGPGPAPSQLAEQWVGWVADKGKGAALGLSRGVCVLQTRVSVGHSARRERHPSENRLALPPGTGLATRRTQGAASRPHPHLHVPRGPRRRLPYRASSRHHSPVPHPRGPHAPGHGCWACQLKWRKSRPSSRFRDCRLSSNAPPVRSCGKTGRRPSALARGPQAPCQVSTVDPSTAKTGRGGRRGWKETRPERETAGLSPPCPVGHRRGVRMGSLRCPRPAWPSSSLSKAADPPQGLGEEDEILDSPLCWPLNKQGRSRPPPDWP